MDTDLNNGMIGYEELSPILGHIVIDPTSEVFLNALEDSEAIYENVIHFLIWQYAMKDFEADFGRLYIEFTNEAEVQTEKISRELLNSKFEKCQIDYKGTHYLNEGKILVDDVQIAVMIQAGKKKKQSDELAQQGAIDFVINWDDPNFSKYIEAYFVDGTDNDRDLLYNSLLDYFYANFDIADFTSIYCSTTATHDLSDIVDGIVPEDGGKWPYFKSMTIKATWQWNSGNGYYFFSDFSLSSVED